jgi:Fe-S cluster assembly ATP-binding protein
MTQSEGSGGQTLLEVRGLSASVGGLEILKGVDLTVKAGEVHAIMGPNGSGKSTFANVLAGKPDYEITGGQALFEGADLLAMEPEIRSRLGVFLAFQYPLELPGVRAWQFLKAAVDAQREQAGEEELSARAFDRMLKEMIEWLILTPIS